MSARTDTELGIMFADIAGSTSLYEKIGDAKAEKEISTALEMIGHIASHHGGNKVKTIGDEIMCRFPDVDCLVRAACEVQREFANRSLGEELSLQVRIGVYFGAVILKKGDVFGDIVNVAARMVRLAQPGQIITSSLTVEKLSDLSIMTRRKGTVSVKGKQEKLQINEILWRGQDAELTQFVSACQEPITQSTLSLHLRFAERTITLSEMNKPFVMGRDEECDLQVRTKQSSRKHASIEVHSDKVLLIDQSTNGTYVTRNGGGEVFVHLEGYSLVESGVISLGHRASVSQEDLIYYQLRSV